MKKMALLLFIVFSLQITIAQEFEMIRHQVALGETVKMISKKYKIEPAEIYRLNKFAVDGISQGQVLQLIVEKKELPPTQVVAETETTVLPPQSDEENSMTTTKTVTTTTVRKKKTVAEEPPIDAAVELGAGSAVTHTVSRGETLSGIAVQYGLSVADIKSQNEKVLKRGLQPGQILAIIKPSGNEVITGDAQIDETVTTTDSSSNTEIKHKVQKGDTLFYLAKKYNVSVDDIKIQNETLLKKGLQPGQVLTITTTN
jgi:LysM repeat protein